jgi:hypothetical protein
VVDLDDANGNDLRPPSKACGVKAFSGCLTAIIAKQWNERIERRL